MSCRTPGVAVVAFAAFGAFACTGETPTTPPPGSDRPLATLSELTTCGQTGLSNHSRYWGCNAIISVGPAPTESNPGIADAISPWHDALLWDALPQVPEIVYRAAAPAIEVSHVHGNADNTWCATNDHLSYIQLDGGNDCQGQFFADQTALITHELAEVLGLNERLEGNDLSPADCTIRIQGLTNLNSRPCAQEVEYIFAGYGLTTVDPTNIWNQTVVTRLSLASHELTVEVGQPPKSNSVTSIRIDPSGTPEVTAPASGATYNWTATSPNIVFIGQSSDGRTATITGANPGTTYVRVTARTATISNGIVGTVARLLGDSVRVVVPAPPPAGTNFRVSDITGPPVPITRAGGEELHAVVEDPYSPDYTVGWYITYSNGSHATISSPYTSSSNYWLPVPAGSYRITVTATAHSSTHYMSHTSYFPVCTGSGGGGGGGDLLRAQLPDSLPGAGTDAVGGC